MKQKNRRRRLALILAAGLGFVAVLAAVFFIYTGIYYHVDPAARDEALQYGIALRQEDGYIACVPAET